MKRFYNKLSVKFKRSFVACLVMLIGAIPAFATTPPAGLNLTFDTAQLFTWTKVITDSMMPIIYVVCGIALGFIIIRSLKSAFN